MPNEPEAASARQTAFEGLGGPVGARERNKRKTRGSIRAAALDLFVEQGFAGTTVEQIAARARVSPRTFFNYYSTKEECVVLPHHELAPVLRSLLLARPRHEPPLVALRETFCALFSELEKSASLRSQIIRAATLQRNEPALRAADGAFKIVWEDTAADVFRERGEKDADARIYAVVGVAAGKTAVLEWATAPGEGTIADALEACFEVLARGVGIGEDQRERRDPTGLRAHERSPVLGQLDGSVDSAHADR